MFLTRIELRPIHALRLEALEDRSLLSSYSITDIGVAQFDHNAYPGTDLRINNAATPQVIGASLGGLSHQHAFVWDNVHGKIDLAPMGHDNFTAANGLNDEGKVTGISENWTLHLDRKTGDLQWNLSSENGFVWTNGQGIQSIGNSVFPVGINNSSELISTRNFQAAVLVGNRWTQLGTLVGGTFTRAVAINDYGQVVGFGDFLGNPSNFTHAFLWTPARPNGTTGAMIDLGTLGTGLGASVASAINSSGMVTGKSASFSIADGADHAFVWSPTSANGSSGTMTDLGTLAVNSSPGLSQSEGLAINRSGVIVGDSNPTGATSQNQIHAVIWQLKAGGGYVLTDLNDLIPAGSGWTLTRADGINDNGQIVVETAEGHALLLTPTSGFMAAAPAITSVTQELHNTQVQPLLTEILHRWQTVGVDTPSVHDIDTQIANLGGTALGLALGHTNTLDDDTSGEGWFVDKRPRSDSEFCRHGNQREKNRMGLLVLLEHELALKRGNDHEETGALQDTLTTGTRHLPGKSRSLIDTGVLDLGLDGETG